MIWKAEEAVGELPERQDGRHSAHCTSRRAFGRLFAATGVGAAATIAMPQANAEHKESGEAQLAQATQQEAEPATEHFSPKGKAPSSHTIAAQEEQRRSLPFSDKQDFEEADRGFIAAPSYKQIMNDKGGVVWDIGRWDFPCQPCR